MTDHDASDGVCAHCDRRYAARFDVECTVCHYANSGIAIVCLLAETKLLAFLTEYRMNPLVPRTRERSPGLLANYGGRFAPETRSGSL